MTDTPDDIVIDWVNENDEVLGPIRRKNIYRENASFRTSHIFIFDAEGRLLLQKLASSRERYPGRWGSSVAGYVLTGESYEAAAQRKLTQELGIAVSDVKLELVGKTYIEDEGRRKFITLYTGNYNGQLKPDTEQMDEAKYFSIDEIEKMRTKEADQFTPTFLHLLDYWQAQK